MGRYILLFFLFCGSSLFLIARDDKKADKLFKAGDYANALEEYSLLSENEPDKAVKAGYRFRIGECYAHMNRPDKAEKNFLDAIKGGYMSPDAFLLLGENQIKLGKYDDALSSFESYKLANPADPIVDKYIASCKFAKENINNVSAFELKRIDAVNSRQSDFGVSYLNESLLFSTTRQASKDSDDDKKKRRNSDDDDEHGSDKNKAYTKSGLSATRIMLSVGTGGKFNRPIDVAELNQMKNFADDGVILYDSYSKQGLYTRQEGKKGVIYKMMLKNNKWEKNDKIEVKSQGEHIGHPYMTPSGDRIYFTSTMPGGKGKSDIWYINKTGADSWSDPINGGDEINTSGNEVYPFIVDDYFFFASDGHVGFGGFDIYASKMENNSPTKPVNLGVPFNSSGDDYNLFMRSDLKEGVLVSNRNLRNSDDIFHFVGFPSQLKASGQVIDKITRKPISNVSLELIVGTKSISKTISDAEGRFTIAVSPKTSYKLKANVVGYGVVEKSFATTDVLFGEFSKATGTDLDFVLGGNATFISGKVVDKFSAPVGDMFVSLLENSIVVQTVRTDPSGIYKFSDLKSFAKYVVQVDPVGYFIDSKEVSMGDVSQMREYSPQTGVDTDLQLESYELNKEVIINGVTFQDGKANLILSESQKELDRIARMFSKNPQLSITLTGYVDTKVSPQSAQELSLLRVNSVRDYLVLKNVKASILTTKAFGRSRPLVNNPKTEEDHQKNNRITYMVTKVNKVEKVTNNIVTPSTPPSPPSTNTSTPPTTTKQFRVQVAALQTLDLKRKEFVKISRELGYDVNYEYCADGKYRYYINDYATRKEAQIIIEKIKSIGVDAVISIKK